MSTATVTLAYKFVATDRVRWFISTGTVVNMRALVYPTHTDIQYFVNFDECAPAWVDESQLTDI